MGEVLQQLARCACGCGLRPKATSSRYIAGHNRSKAPFQFIVDQSSGCWVWQLYKDSSGYGMSGRNGIRIRSHILYFKWFYGRLPKNHIDHICTNKSCVNPTHLRDASRSENLTNTKIYKNNKTGFKGVYPNQNKNTYQVTIRRNNKTISIGHFTSVLRAAKAYDDAIRRLSKRRPIRVNFPKGKDELPAR